MPIRIATVTVPFKDEDGRPLDDASFTIRRRLSHDAQLEYLEAAADFEVDPETGEVKTSMSKLKIREITGIMLRGALVSWTGVEDAEGRPLPLERAGEADAFYLAQITQEIQRRNAGESKADGPKDGAPSATS